MFAAQISTMKIRSSFDPNINSYRINENNRGNLDKENKLGLDMISQTNNEKTRSESKIKNENEC